MENIDYLKTELEKDINQIDWKEFLRVAKSCYDKTLEKSILGLNKGVLNIITSNNAYSSGLYNYLDTNKNFFTVFWCYTQPALNKLIKENKISDEVINSDKYVVIIIGNTAALIKKIFNLKWDYLLFKISKSKENYFLTQGENKIKYNKNTLVGLHREIIINKMLE
jgi:hypothetical protein